MKNLTLLNDLAQVTIYRLVAGQFEYIELGILKIDDLESVAVDEFRSLKYRYTLLAKQNPFQLLLKIGVKGSDANAVMQNLEMEFSDGQTHDLGKMIRIPE